MLNQALSNTVIAACCMFLFPSLPISFSPLEPSSNQTFPDIQPVIQPVLQIRAAF